MFALPVSRTAVWAHPALRVVMNAFNGAEGVTRTRGVAVTTEWQKFVAEHPPRNGVPAGQGLPAGELLFRIPLAPERMTASASTFSLQVGPEGHVNALDLENEMWVCMNHACTPTASATIAVVDDVVDVSAAVDLAPGAAVTFDYNTTEAFLADPFTCSCGAPSCVGSVAGYTTLSVDQRRARPVVAPYLLASSSSSPSSTSSTSL
ncbi:uncharacterized protein AMSG_11264 [Thecamonas trahens ATCC 50062]|uniref:Post-SET domain-containing protein n=1 Tax=Thecamonas trahens ATCC 50062 TaxID=461836 RepID=A0A0L0DU15_THETB|nr:hypothetical protein AMSG_11264 [Thecamonas trahens ATCC 50062]KNC55824.1 hypothetical protein AMSG_11264 [Thecamonas trahens ATCC 50062]|eukprot:XP_013752801.1 hypothetical protein AMSG_11264 [Thecamonas trahens ATCC 50062]